jgi:hypothetical protein
MFQAETPFVLFECLYLIVVLCYVFTQSKLVCWLAYSLAGLKYSLSSLESIDITVYERVYKAVKGFGLEPVQQMEGGFTSLLFLAKITNLSLTVFHFIIIIVFLLSVTFLFRSFLPKSKATLISLLFGFFPVGGELCLYLLRQLLSTTVVFFGMGFLFRKQPFKALIISLGGFLFHSTTAIYIPLFISGFFRKKFIKVSIILGSYLLFFVIIYNFELGYNLISNFTGDSSIYYLKYIAYIKRSGEEGYRDAGSMGLLTISMLLYFISINLWYRIYFLRSQNFLFYFFTILLVVFQFSLESLRLFWISSRLNFISDMLLLASNILISIEALPKKYYKSIIIGIVVLMFWASVILITKDYETHGLFRLSL